MFSSPDQKFVDEILNLHNYYRAKHSAPNLRIDKKLNESAQNWAQNLARFDKFEHKPNNVYGENLFFASNTDPQWKISPKMVMEAWYDEHKLYRYHYKTPHNIGEVGHFTQTVWTETRLLGVGIATSATGNVYVVCHYDPPGNINGQFDQHVRGPKGRGGGDVTSRSNSQVSIEMLENLDVIPSLETLGIRPKTRANAETIRKLQRKYELPAARFYAWLSWLVQVTEEGKKWQKWLKTRIVLIQTILKILSGDILIPTEIMDVLNIQRQNELAAVVSSGGKGGGGGKKKKEDEIVPDGDEEKPSQLRGEINRTQDDLLRSQSTDKKNKSLAVVEEEPTSPSQRPQATEVVNEKLNRAAGKPRKRMAEENSSEVPRASEAFDEIPWPIGVPWVPQEFDKNKKSKHKQEELKLAKDKTPSPRNKKEMAEVMKRMIHQATIYRSLYKHWNDLTHQAEKQVIEERSAIMRNRVYHPPTNEKIPYFFYLYNPPDVDSAIQRDDKAIVLRHMRKEKISKKNSP